MSSRELSFESTPLLRVTWTIPDFFRLVKESEYSLRSPDFTFSDGRYYLRLFRTWDLRDNWIVIELLNSIETDRGTAVLHEVQLKSGTREIDLIRYIKKVQTMFRLYETRLECERDVYVPDGTLTVLCSVRSIESGSAGSRKSGEAQTRALPECRMTGKLSSEPFPFLYVTWEIPAFFQKTRESECTLDSHEFPFSDRRFRLRFIVRCTKYLEIQIVNMTDTVPGRYVSYEVGLKSTTGEEIYLARYGPSTERSFRIFRTEFDDMHRVRFPDGHLAVFCYMRSRELTSAESPKSGGAETPDSKAPVSQAAAHPRSSGAETSNEEDDKEGLLGISKLLSDLGQLLKKMPDSDASLVVSGKEFRAHKMMLRARSTVFDAMFGHETAEKTGGRVVIDDLDPDSFDDFLEYLYTGTVGAGLSEENVFGLYKAAHKYDVPTLKAECVAHMRRSRLSVDSFCDVLAVALQQSDEELLSQAVLFFKQNMARIIVTVKRQQFVIDNGTSANELFIRAVVPPKQ